MAPPSYSQFETRHRLPSPTSSALLVIDVQNHFQSIASPILPSLRSTIALFRAARLPIIFTRHVDLPPAPKSSDRRRTDMLREWWPTDFIADGSHAADLIPGLGFDPAIDRLVVKHTYSSFLGTGLEEILDGLGVEEVVVTGVMTNLCCETAAREAFVRGFRVFFSADATATASEEMHEATLRNLGYGFAYLVDCGRLASALGNKD